MSSFAVIEINNVCNESSVQNGCHTYGKFWQKNRKNARLFPNFPPTNVSGGNILWDAINERNNVCDSLVWFARPEASNPHWDLLLLFIPLQRAFTLKHGRPARKLSKHSPLATAIYA